MPEMENQLTRLHRFIVNHYDLEELRTLCFNLDVSSDDLGGYVSPSLRSFIRGGLEIEEIRTLGSFQRDLFLGGKK